MEINLFDVEAAVKSHETTEGHKLIVDFLRKCKQIQEDKTSNEAMMEEITKLKQELLQSNNKYVESLMA